MIDFNLENACLLMNKMRYFAVKIRCKFASFKIEAKV